MKNFVQRGDVLTLIAPYLVASGDGVQVGAAIFGVAASDAAQGGSVDVVTHGVVDLTKTSAEAWTVGQPVYWDDAAKEVTNVAAANIRIGVAVAVAVNPSSTGRVRLNGSF